MEVTKDDALSVVIEAHHRKIAVVFNTDDIRNIEELSKHFVFLGYDLVKEMTAISALTNCGSSYGLAIDYEKLNCYGLIDDKKIAKKTHQLLSGKYNYDEHADCILIGVWRRLRA